MGGLIDASKPVWMRTRPFRFRERVHLAGPGKWESERYLGQILHPSTNWGPQLAPFHSPPLFLNSLLGKGSP